MLLKINASIWVLCYFVFSYMSEKLQKDLYLARVIKIFSVMFMNEIHANVSSVPVTLQFFELKLLDSKVKRCLVVCLEGASDRVVNSRLTVHYGGLDLSDGGEEDLLSELGGPDEHKVAPALSALQELFAGTKGLFVVQVAKLARLVEDGAQGAPVAHSFVGALQVHIAVRLVLYVRAWAAFGSTCNCSSSISSCSSSSSTCSSGSCSCSSDSCTCSSGSCTWLGVGSSRLNRSLSKLLWLHCCRLSSICSITWLISTCCFTSLLRSCTCFWLRSCASCSCNRNYLRWVGDSGLLGLGRSNLRRVGDCWGFSHLQDIEDRNEFVPNSNTIINA